LLVNYRSGARLASFADNMILYSSKIRAVAVVCVIFVCFSSAQGLLNAFCRLLLVVA